jgi:hypothetical protein
MKAIVPVTLTTSNTTNNIPITETLWTAGTYTIGTQRYLGMWLYEVTATSTTQQPSETASDWTIVSAINKYKMIDNRYNSVSTNTTSITVTIYSNKIVEAIALLNIQGTSLNVKVKDDLNNIIYNKDVVLQDYSPVIGWWSYFFTEIQEKNDIILDDIPPYSNVNVEITITGVTCSLGEISLGSLFDLGFTQFDTTVSIIDYSKKETTAIGETVLIQGVYVKKVDYAIQIPRTLTPAVFKFLSQYRATPLVWIGEIEREEINVFGFYRDFNIILSNPAVDMCSLNVEGL